MCFIVHPLPFPDISICLKTCLDLKAALIDFWPLWGRKTAKQADRNTALTYYYLFTLLCLTF